MYVNIYIYTYIYIYTIKFACLQQFCKLIGHVVVFARVFSRLTKTKAQVVAYRNAANGAHPAMPVDEVRDELTQELQKLDGRLRPGSTLVSFLQQQTRQDLRDALAQKLRDKVWWCEGEEEEQWYEDDFVVDPELDPESEPSEDDEDARLAQIRQRGSIMYISDEELDEAQKQPEKLPSTAKLTANVGWLVG
jgi:hypothetical protein